MRVNSLLCYKGRTGETVTLSIASPCVLSLTAHGLLNGTAIVLTTTGALPTGLTAGTTYYTRYVASGTAHLYDTLAHAIDTASTTGRIDTSGTQSGTHTIWSSYWHNLSSGDRLRYGTAGSERAYATMKLWIAGRSTASGADDEYLEIVDEFVDVITASADTLISYAKIPSYSVNITTTVNGVRTQAFHNGKIDRGYYINQTTSGNTGLTLARSNINAEGFRTVSVSSYSCYLNSSCLKGSLGNMICSSPGGTGLLTFSVTCLVYNILSHSSLYGVSVASGADQGTIMYNVTAVKNTDGFTVDTGSGSYTLATIINCVSYGNTTSNWKTGVSMFGEIPSKNNAGASGNDPWGTGDITTVTNADFVDFTNNDFRLVSTSVLRDVGFTVPSGYAKDIIDKTRPNYSAGTATADLWDIGAFEYDSGNGESPLSVTLSVASIISGSQVRISKVSDNTEIYNGSPGTSLSQAYTYTGDLAIKVSVRKSGYIEWIGLGTIIASGFSITAAQVVDPTA